MEQAGPVRNRLEHWARVKPQVAAIHDGDRAISWEEWDRRANAVAAYLQTRGITADDVVAARTQNRIEWAIVWAAVAKIGATLLGMNWRLTAAEARFVLEDSGATGLFCDDADPTALASVIASRKLKFAVCIERTAAGFDSFDAISVGHAPALFAQEDSSLIIYTSGTTGQPKGAITSRLTRSIDDATYEYMRSVAGIPQPEDSVVLIALPMHHAAGPGNVRTAIGRGNTMVFMRRFDAVEALMLIERHRITVLNGVPTMFKRIAALPPEVLAQYDVSSVKTVGVGAAPVPHSLKEWMRKHFRTSPRERYGTTEVGVIAALDSEDWDCKRGSSGRLVAHAQVKILNAAGAAVASGGIGEIWAKTPVTIDGYLGKGKPGPDILDAQGFFRTGDIGRLDEDGFLYITDRASDMIISGGVNIYPAEIEAALSRHPAIQDIAVIGIPDEEFGERVKAFCEIKPGARASESELLAFAADHLASYKRPREIEFVAELPRNAMHKILKRELRAPYWQHRERNV